LTSNEEKGRDQQAGKVSRGFVEDMGEWIHRNDGDPGAKLEQ
jgi:hypothetical protein